MAWAVRSMRRLHSAASAGHVLRMVWVESSELCFFCVGKDFGGRFWEDLWTVWWCRGVGEVLEFFEELENWGTKPYSPEFVLRVLDWC